MRFPCKNWKKCRFRFRLSVVRGCPYKNVCLNNTTVCFRIICLRNIMSNHFHFSLISNNIYSAILLLFYDFYLLNFIYLFRLRQESELLSRSSHWSQSDLQSASSANNITENNSSESTSSSETLKWLGSMSDVSVSSHATNSSNISGSGKFTFYA